MRLFLLAFLLADPTFGAELILTWTDNSTNEDGFIIQRAPTPDTGTALVGSFVEIARVGKDVVTYTDKDLPQGTRYTYRVAAFNAFATSPFSAMASATTKVDSVAAPTYLKVKQP